MRWLSALRWSLVGLISASVGCLAGGLLGSFWLQTVVSATAAGAAFGLLIGRPRLIVIAAGTAAAVSCVVYYLGTMTVSPLLAWPLAGLAIGLAALPALSGRGARIATVISAPILAGIGFACGSALVALLGLTLDNSQWVSQFMLGGAAGFGFLVLAGMRLATWRASQ
ncbi:MAG: hypothetical protein EHM23_32595 [Acidobacteria bacterium]|nr:MAG: hypothetical protein EHM23_32595 [Acidobacteriota bacterium]